MRNLTWAAQFAEQFRAGIVYPRWLSDSFDGLGAPLLGRAFGDARAVSRLAAGCDEAVGRLLRSLRLRRRAWTWARGDLPAPGAHFAGLDCDREVLGNVLLPTPELVPPDTPTLA